MNEKKICGRCKMLVDASEVERVETQLPFIGIKTDLWCKTCITAHNEKQKNRKGFF
jgi:hypothetical protein